MSATDGRALTLVLRADPDELAPLRQLLHAWLGGLGIPWLERYPAVVACIEACSDAIESATADSLVLVEVDRDTAGLLVVVHSGRSALPGTQGSVLSARRELRTRMLRALALAVRVDCDAEGRRTTIRLALAAAP